MKVLLALSDFLEKMKRITYSRYQLERRGESVLITLFSGQRSIAYQITDSLSAEKQTEVAGLLELYRS